MEIVRSSTLHRIKRLVAALLSYPGRLIAVDLSSTPADPAARRVLRYMSQKQTRSRADGTVREGRLSLHQPGRKPAGEPNIGSQIRRMLSMPRMWLRSD